MQISLRLLLLLGFSLLFFCEWIIPVILIREGVSKSITDVVDILVHETGKSMAQSIERQFATMASSALTLQNWSVNNGRPFDSAINHRTFLRYSTGLFLLQQHFVKSNFQFRFSRQVCHCQHDPFSTTARRYALCRSDGDYNFSYPNPATHPLEKYFDCDLQLLNTTTREVVPSPDNYIHQLLPRSYFNSSMLQLIWAQTARPSSSPQYGDFFMLPVLYAPLSKEKLVIPMVSGAMFRNTNNPVVALGASLGVGFIGEILSELLPKNSGISRAYLLDNQNRVLATSNGAAFDEFVNVSASEFAALFNPVLCAYEGVSRGVACLHNISTHHHYWLLREANAISST